MRFPVDLISYFHNATLHTTHAIASTSNLYTRFCLLISEFLNICGPHAYPTSEMMTFMVQGKNQFIELGNKYSNNKH
jgi:hypothetical protein